MIKKAHLEAASLCTAKNDIIYYLNGVNIEVLNNHIVTLTATNGHYLSCHNSDCINETGERFSLIIPTDTIKAAIKSADRKSVMIEIEKLDDTRYMLGNQIFTPIDGKFPDYKRVIPSAFDVTEMVYYNYDYLALGQKVILKATGCDKPMLYQNGSSASVMVAPNDNSFIFVVMPLKIDLDKRFTGFQFPPESEV